MKNILLKTFTLCFFLFLGLSQTFAQEYKSTEDALSALKAKNIEAANIMLLNKDEKNMEYYKAVSTRKLIGEMIGGFKAGNTVAEIAQNHDGTLKANKARSIKPLFPDSKGKYGSNWINEEIISLLIVQ